MPMDRNKSDSKSNTMGLVIIPAGTSLLSQAQLIQTFQQILPSAHIVLHSRLPENTIFPFLMNSGVDICSDEGLSEVLASHEGEVHLFFTHANVEARMKSLNCIVESTGRFPTMWGTHETRKRQRYQRRLLNLCTNTFHSFILLPEALIRRNLPANIHDTVKVVWQPEKNRLKVTLTFPKKLNNMKPVQRRTLETHAVTNLTELRNKFGHFSIEAYHDIHPELGTYDVLVTRLREHNIYPVE